MCVADVNPRSKQTSVSMRSSGLSQSLHHLLLQGQAGRRVAGAGSCLQADGAVQFGRALGVGHELPPVHLPLPHGDHEQRGEHDAAQRQQAESRDHAAVQVGAYPGALHLQPLHLPRRHAVAVHLHVPRHGVGDNHQGDPGHQERDRADEAVVHGTPGAFAEGEVVLGHERELRQSLGARLAVAGGPVRSFAAGLRAGQSQVDVLVDEGEGGLQFLVAANSELLLAAGGRAELPLRARPALRCPRC